MPYGRRTDPNHQAWPSRFTAANAPPVAIVDFVGVPLIGYEPLIVAFTDLSTNGPTSWAWDFENDGIVDSVLQHPVRNYPAVGIYQVKLAVVSPAGAAQLVKLAYVTVLHVCVSGPTWTLRNHGVASYDIRSCGYGLGLWVIGGIVGTNAIALYSTDRISWTQSPDTNNVSGVDFANLCFGNGVFIAGGSSLQALRSTNGINWTSITTPNVGTTGGAFFANNNFFLCSSSQSTTILRSTDAGLTFSTVALGGTFGATAGATNGTRIVLVHQTGARYSDDAGATWSAGTVPSPWPTGLGRPSVAYGNGVFVAVMRAFSNSESYVSADGATWSAGGTLPVVNTWDGLIFSEGTFMAVGNTLIAAPAISSNKGVTWTSAPNSLPAIGYDTFAADGAGKYLAIPRGVGTALASGEC